MKFKSVNEMETFNFQDCVIKKLKIERDRVTAEVEALIVNGNNSQNNQFFASYLGETVITMENARISSIILEGNETYDPDGKLLEKVEDKTISVLEYPKVEEECRDAFMCTMEKAGEEDGRFTYIVEFEIPSEEEYDFMGIHFYEMTVSFDRISVEWDRYMNRV